MSLCRKASTSRTSKLSERAAKLSAIGFALIGVCVLYLTCKSLATGSPVEAGWAIFTELALSAALIAGCAWAAVRLWRRWNAATIRWIVGATMALAILSITSRLDRLLGARPGNLGLMLIPALVLGAFAYRKISRKLIQVAAVEDPFDLYGQHQGHATRVRAFAFIFGWAVWIGVSSLTSYSQRLSVGPSLIELITTFGAILLGWGAYRLILWRMLPRCAPALPSGYGFDVIPIQQSDSSQPGPR
jgi:hypothetical protein